MRPSLVLFHVAIVGPLLFCRGVWSHGGKFATSLCDELITPSGYNCIEHQVVTDDGFILGVQNMPPPRGTTEPSNGPPVLLMHGLTAGGETWVVNSSEESFALILADAGFDVWIANNRVAQWSHGHQTYSPSDDAYWAWTYDEPASYDLQASTKFVYNQRGGMKLTYVGHSQGALMLLAGLTGGAFKTEVLGYLNAAVLLAPVTSVAHVTAVLIQVGLTLYTDQILTVIGVQQFDSNIFFNITCSNPAVPAAACRDLFTGLIGPNSYLNSSRLDFYSQYYPQATSSLNLNHFGQSLRTDTFQFYDKGSSGNLAAYGRATPPPYDLTTFPTSLPLQIWTGGIDASADPIDLSAALAKLPSSNREVRTLANYGQGDFVFGYMSYVDVYPGVVSFLHAHT